MKEPPYNGYSSIEASLCLPHKKAVSEIFSVLFLLQKGLSDTVSFENRYRWNKNRNSLTGIELLSYPSHVFPHI